MVGATGSRCLPQPFVAQPKQKAPHVAGPLYAQIMLNATPRGSKATDADRNRRNVLNAFRLEKVVGAIGFEPTTSRSRTERSTKLSHAPTKPQCSRKTGATGATGAMGATGAVRCTGATGARGAARWRQVRGVRSGAPLPRTSAPPRTPAPHQRTCAPVHLCTAPHLSHLAHPSHPSHPLSHLASLSVGSGNCSSSSMAECAVRSGCSSDTEM